VTEPSPPQGPDRDAAAIADAAQDWLLRRQGGSPTAAEQARFAAWCDADPRHRAAYAEVAALWRDAAALEHVFAPHGQQQPAQESAQEQVAIPGAPPPRLVRRRGLAVAFSLLAVAGMLLFVFLPSISYLPEHLLADHATALGEQKRVVLPDGSVALLNTGSAIDIAYTDQRRVVTLLHGEAWFEVVKDANRPFDVVAAAGRATAVGTAFAVRHDDDGATVTVTEGVVGVTSPDTEAAADAQRLVEAGQQVSYRRGAAPGNVRTLDAAAATAWRYGVIVIRDRPLGEALAEIGRYRTGRVILLGETSRHGLVTARLSLSDIDGGIDALAATHGLTVTRVTDWLLIVR
jgi:transmembrane sensor